MTENERLVNAGTVITTQAYGEVTVREFDFRQLNGLVRGIAKIFTQLKIGGDQDIGQVLLENMDSMDVADPLEDILAVAIGQKKPLDLKLTEGLEILNAVIELNDWESIRRLFFGIMEKVGARVTPAEEAAEAPVVSQTS